MAERSPHGVVDIGDMKIANLSSNTEQNHKGSGENMGAAMSTTTPAAHFFSDRYAYRERPDILPELVTLGVIVLTAAWPILLLANAIATGR